MSELIAIVYPREDRAADVMASLRQLQAAHLVDLEDACHVTKDARGRVELHQSINLAAHGAVGGAFWGSLVGLVLLNPLIGLVTGAAAGGVLGAFRDIGISDDFMKKLGADMAPGTSAIFALLRRATLDKVGPELGRYGGRLLHTSLDGEREARLRAFLDGHGVPTLPPAAAVVSLTPHDVAVA